MASVFPAHSFSLGELDWRLVSSFGVICFGLVGLELGPVMGDEIRDPQRTVPRSVLWGGFAVGERSTWAPRCACWWRFPQKGG